MPLVALALVASLQIATPVLAPLCPIAPLGSPTSEHYVFLDGNLSVVHAREEAQRVRAAYGPRVFWFTDGRRAYVVRDAAALDQIRELFRAQLELGRRQAALGREQAEMGRRQGDWARSQVRMALAPDRESRARMIALASDMRATGERMRRLGDEMRSLGDRMREQGVQIDRRLRPRLREWIERGIAREEE